MYKPLENQFTGVNKMKEEWKDIENYEGSYQISNFGRVKSYKKNSTRIMKLQKNKKGYLRVNLSKKCKYQNFLIHRLVANAFIPNPNNLPQVNHIDGNKVNNNIQNLEWINNQENIIHAWKTGLKTKIYGKPRNSKSVNQYDLRGNFIKTWDSIKSASEKLKINSTGISRCCKKKKYYRTSGGYRWEYTNTNP